MLANEAEMRRHHNRPDDGPGQTGHQPELRGNAVETGPNRAGDASGNAPEPGLAMDESLY